jgi:amidase
MTDLAPAGVAETARMIAEGEVSSRTVVEAALARIGERDGELNAFSAVLAEEAIAEADARDAAGTPIGPLHGVPVAIKEEIDVAGSVTTFGGDANSTPAAHDAEVVVRLRAAGAVVIGKTTMAWSRSAWAATAAARSGSRARAAGSSA